ncbi:MAG: hypothetical protein ACREOO_29195 [bacterium]
MIYLECNPDKALVSALGIPKNKTIHAYSKGNVCNRLTKCRDSHGLIDEDPESSQPSFLRNLENRLRQDDVVLLYHRASNNYLIVLCPRLEEWILEAAKEAAVDPNKHGLSNEADQLHETICTRIDNFRRLVDDIKAKSQRMKTLSRFLRA